MGKMEFFQTELLFLYLFSSCHNKHNNDKGKLKVDENESLPALAIMCSQEVLEVRIVSVL